MVGGRTAEKSTANIEMADALKKFIPQHYKCMAGYKLFFVSAEKFLICSTVHTNKHIMDVTLNDLYANYRKKLCQKGCGVYCTVSASLLVEKPA